MNDAAESSPIVDGGPEVGKATPEASVEVSEAPEKSDDTQAEKPKMAMRTPEMVNSAIVALNEPGGSSLQAIKKYMAENYNVDTKKKALFIKKYLISAVDAGVLYRTKGHGAMGSFRVSKERKVVKAKPKIVVEETSKPIVPEKAQITKKSAVVNKQAASAKEKADAAKKQAAERAKKAAAKKKQAAADEKLARAMKKLEAATRKAAIAEAIAEMDSRGKRTVNKLNPATSKPTAAVPEIPAEKTKSAAPNKTASTASSCGR